MSKIGMITRLRQLEQRHVSAEVALMEWNPTLDLIALATVTGEIVVHRLSWQKVWSISSPSTSEETVLVTALAWRPDGKILAYAYDNGKILLCDVENSETVHILEIHCVVTHLSWIECSEEEDDQKPFYFDRSGEFLQKQYTCNKNYGSVPKQTEEIADDFKKMKGQKNLNILVVGMETGIIQFHSYGMFPLGFIDIKTHALQDRIISMTLSKDFKILTVIFEYKNSEGVFHYYYRSYAIPLLSNYMEEIKIVTLKYGHISSLLAYLSSTIQAISEAWEDILLEVDTKIHKYALQKSTLSEGSISDDFLELMMFGNPSDSLEKFLLHDLTESGLKKFGHSIELSYSNIQKLVLKRLQNASFSLFYHLNDFKGMAQWKERFGALGLEESSIKEAVLCVGSFLLKAIEIQQVIDSSMKNFKAFFRWLYSVILRLSEEPIPLEISRLTQEDLNFVAEFLKENFNFEYDENKKTTVKLERVAQYLKKEDLAYPAPTAGNPWIKFLEEHPNFKESGLIFPYYSNKSLVTLYSDLCKLIDTSAVKGPWSILKDKSTIKTYQFLYKNNFQKPPLISHISCEETGDMYTIVSNQPAPCSHFYLIREKINSDEIVAVGMGFFQYFSGYPQHASTESKNNQTSTETRKDLYKISDMKFYNKQTITFILLENFESEYGCPILLQMIMSGVTLDYQPLIGSHMFDPFSRIPIMDMSPFIEKNNYKRMENVKASCIAVSGSRKVARVLFFSKRQIRLFEMDVEDEEEDEDPDDSLMKDVSKDFQTPFVEDEEKDMN